MKQKIFALMIACIFLFTACNSAKPVEGSNNEAQTNAQVSKKIVYTSFYPIYDFTSKIAQDKLDIRLIIPAGAEPHDYEVGAKTLTEMSDGDLILLLGLEFEPWAEGFDDKTKSKTVMIGEKARPIEYKDDHDHEEGEGHEEDEHKDEDKDHEEEGHHHGFYDPHVWLDPTRASEMSKAILEELVKLDPDNKDFYTKNHEAFAEQLTELDKGLKDIAENNKQHKDIIVSHNAFAYLTDTYGIHFESIAGLSPEAEPSLKTISEMIDKIKKEEIRYIFFEELSNSKVIESISKETDAKVDVLYTIEGMTEEEMKKGEDYVSKMNQNIEKIKLALE